MNFRLANFRCDGSIAWYRRDRSYRCIVLVLVQVPVYWIVRWVLVFRTYCTSSSRILRTDGFVLMDSPVRCLRIFVPTETEVRDSLTIRRVGVRGKIYRQHELHFLKGFALHVSFLFVVVGTLSVVDYPLGDFAGSLGSQTQQELTQKSQQIEANLGCFSDC